MDLLRSSSLQVNVDGINLELSPTSPKIKRQGDQIDPLSNASSARSKHVRQNVVVRALRDSQSRQQEVKGEQVYNTPVFISNYSHKYGYLDASRVPFLAREYYDRRNSQMFWDFLAMILTTIKVILLNFSIAYIVVKDYNPDKYVPIVFVHFLIGFIVIEWTQALFSDYFPVCNARAQLIAPFTVTIGNMYDTFLQEHSLSLATDFLTLSESLQDEFFYTLLGGSYLITLYTGIVLFTIGATPLGTVTNFVPAPVRTGILSIIGVSLFRLGVSSSGADTKESLFTPSNLLHWVPSYVFMFAVFLASKLVTKRKGLIFPIFIISTFSLFYIILYATGHTYDEAVENAFFVKITTVSIVEYYNDVTNGLSVLNWSVLSAHAFELFVVSLVGPIINAAVNLPLVETLLSPHADLDTTGYSQKKDLILQGIGNIVNIGLFGGVAYGAFAASFNHVLSGGTSRFSLILVSSFLTLLVLLHWSLAVISYAPNTVVSALVSLPGFSVLYNNLWVNRNTIPVNGMVVALVMFFSFIVGLVDLLNSILIGIVLFSFSEQFILSRQNPLQSINLGDHVQSLVIRHPGHKLILDHVGGQIITFQLRGTINAANSSTLFINIILKCKEIYDKRGFPFIFLILNLESTVNINSIAINNFLRNLNRHGTFIHRVCLVRVPPMSVNIFKVAIGKSKWIELGVDLNEIKIITKESCLIKLNINGFKDSVKRTYKKIRNCCCMTRRQFLDHVSDSDSVFNVNSTYTSEFDFNDEAGRADAEHLLKRLLTKLDYSHKYPHTTGQRFIFLPSMESALIFCENASLFPYLAKNSDDFHIRNRAIPVAVVPQLYLLLPKWPKLVRILAKFRAVMVMKFLFGRYNDFLTHLYYFVMKIPGEYSRLQTVVPGEMLYNEDAKNNYLYILCSGSFVAGSSMPIYKLGRDDVHDISNETNEVDEIKLTSVSSTRYSVRFTFDTPGQILNPFVVLKDVADFSLVATSSSLVFVLDLSCLGLIGKDSPNALLALQYVCMQMAHLMTIRISKRVDMTEGIIATNDKANPAESTSLKITSSNRRTGRANAETIESDFMKRAQVIARRERSLFYKIHSGYGRIILLGTNILSIPLYTYLNGGKSYKHPSNLYLTNQKYPDWQSNFFSRALKIYINQGSVEDRLGESTNDHDENGMMIYRRDRIAESPSSLRDVASFDMGVESFHSAHPDSFSSMEF